VAGNTALCTGGRSGNYLHYRGDDILDLAAGSEYEEVALLQLQGKLTNRAELKAYKAKLKALRGLPEALKTALLQLTPSAHPMVVMRTGV
uniref:citrate/2-methylcitrate synthase n=1 Tax=Acinetobacter baumannii TaxID=470 RepID=UPI000A4E1314